MESEIIKDFEEEGLTIVVLAKKYKKAKTTIKNILQKNNAVKLKFGTRTCVKCSVKKSVKDFCLTPKGDIGTVCIECYKNRKCATFHRNKHKYQERIKSYSKIYTETNSALIKSKAKARREQGYGRAAYQKHKDKINKQHSIYLKNKYNNDVEYKIKIACRNRMWKVLNKIKKVDKTINLIGCTIDFLKNYLQSKFQEGMTWENYGLHGWHIDHIVPCSSFDLTKEEEQRKCFHYTNLQPLWAKENLKKGDKYEKVA